MFEDAARSLGEEARGILNDARFPHTLVEASQAANNVATAAGNVSDIPLKRTAESVSRAANTLSDTATGAQQLMGPATSFLTTAMLGQGLATVQGLYSATSQSRIATASESIANSLRSIQNQMHQNAIHGESAKVKARTLLRLCHWLVDQQHRQDRQEPDQPPTIKIQLVGSNFRLDSVHILEVADQNSLSLDCFFGDDEPVCKSLQDAIDKASQYVERSANDEKSNGVFCIFALIGNDDPQNSPVRQHHIKVPYSITTGGYSIIGVGTDAHAIDVTSTVEIVRGHPKHVYEHGSANGNVEITIISPEPDRTIAQEIKRAAAVGGFGVSIGAVAKCVILGSAVPHSVGAAILFLPVLGTGAAAGAASYGCFLMTRKMTRRWGAVSRESKQN